MFYLVIKLTKPLTLLKAQVVRDEKLRDVSVSSFSVRTDVGLLYTQLEVEVENIKTGRVSAVVFNLHQLKETEELLWDTR